MADVTAWNPLGEPAAARTSPAEAAAPIEDRLADGRPASHRRRRRVPTKLLGLPTRWAAGVGGAILAGVLGLALVLQTNPSAACAAPPTGSSVHSGKATFYDIAGGGGNCSYDGPPSNLLHVALGPSEYSGAAACGGYLDVTGPKGKVRVKILDQCPECAAGHIDLSKEAFAKIADPVQGIVSVKFKAAINPSLPGPLTFRMKEGASRFWFAVRVDNHGNPLKSVQAKTAGGSFKTLTREDFNYWVFDSGLGGGPFTIKITDVYGTATTASGIDLSPGQTQKTSIRPYGAGSAPANTAAKPAKSASKSPQSTPSPSGSASAAPSAAATATGTAEPIPSSADAQSLTAADASCTQ